ncbi:hypothetical protein BDV95DRAFT_485838 [Massariosphaeria phaeospora]|uniref:DUF3752 domain-containing protein n=1 Tax=Massariosphaeria phaeospora TaxID=100035 RepID=A0A7C8M9Z1_9PLEO|nr:hypothetical protein BDV95DRAFT_485838 [Massariosphaeria phaeospora]
MPSIGPSLPPHLAKRSRDDGDDGSSSPDASEKRRRVAGPAPPPSHTHGPSLPPPSTSRASSEDGDVGPAPPPNTSKPARVLGPAPPPAPLDERPPNPPDDDDSDSSDDDFGPAPPPVDARHNSRGAEDRRPTKSAFDNDPKYAEETHKVERAAWMTMPPTQDDLSARMDPTKIRARKFNSGKGAQPSSGSGGVSVWTETPEQKLKRLQDEAMGIIPPSNSPRTSKESKRSKEEEAKARRVKDQIEKSRGKSLVEQHKDKRGGKDEDDDPSARIFDYEKDMGAGMKIGQKQRTEMLQKSKGFGDRFSSGSFL